MQHSANTYPPFCSISCSICIPGRMWKQKKKRLKPCPTMVSKIVPHYRHAGTAEAAWNHRYNATNTCVKPSALAAHMGRPSSPLDTRDTEENKISCFLSSLTFTHPFQTISRVKKMWWKVSHQNMSKHNKKTYGHRTAMCKHGIHFFLYAFFHTNHFLVVLMQYGVKLSSVMCCPSVEQ